MPADGAESGCESEDGVGEIICEFRQPARAGGMLICRHTGIVCRQASGVIAR